MPLDLTLDAKGLKASLDSALAKVGRLEADLAAALAENAKLRAAAGAPGAELVALRAAHAGCATTLAAAEAKLSAVLVLRQSWLDASVIDHDRARARRRLGYARALGTALGVPQ